MATKKRNFFQEGGAPTAPQGGDPAMGGGAAPGQTGQSATGGDIQGMITQYAETRDPELAVQICDGLVQAMGIEAGAAAAPEGGMGGGGAQGAGAPPQGGTPQMANGGKAKFAKGGRLGIKSFLSTQRK